MKSRRSRVASALLLAVVAALLLPARHSEAQFLPTGVNLPNMFQDDIVQKYGYSVSIDGNLAAVGAPNMDYPRLNSGAVHLFEYRFVGSEYIWVEQLVNSAPAIQPDLSSVDRGNMSFGQSVALDGTRLVVGSPALSTMATRYPSVYLFQKTSQGWNQIEEWSLLNGNATDSGGAFDRFGCSVAVDGEIIVVGAAGDDGPDTHYNNALASNCGAVYVYEKTQSGWNKTDLRPTNPIAQDMFGMSVSVSNGTIVVGAPAGEIGSISDVSPGHVYVFEKVSNVWTECRLQLPDVGGLPALRNGDQFGSSVAVDSGNMVVGAAGSSSRTGCAYVFARGPAGWSYVTRLEPPAGDVPGRFGHSVSISGETIVVGSIFSSVAGAQSGAAYVFRKIGPSWELLGRLTVTDTNAWDYFGASVSVSVTNSGIRALVGAPWKGAGDEQTDNTGSAYVFSWESNVVLVDAGTDRSITMPTDTVNLQGSITRNGQSIDPDQVQWISLSSPDNVVFDNPSSRETPVHFSAPGTYTLQLVASVDGASYSDTVTVEVKESQSDGLTPGSVVFTGPNGELSEDNDNFFWNDTDNRLGIGKKDPTSSLDVAGNARITGALQIGESDGYTLPTSNGEPGQILQTDGQGSTSWTLNAPAWTDIRNAPTEFPPSSHNHDSNYVNTTGDTMTGDLIVESNVTVKRKDPDEAHLKVKSDGPVARLTIDGSTQSRIDFPRNEGNRWAFGRDSNDDLVLLRWLGLQPPTEGKCVQRWEYSGEHTKFYDQVDMQRDLVVNGDTRIYRNLSVSHVLEMHASIRRPVVPPSPLLGEAKMWAQSIGWGPGGLPGLGGTEMQVMDSWGNVTTISPHNFTLFEPDRKEPLPWSYYSKNVFLGKEVNVDICGAVRALEELTKKKFIYVKNLPKEEKLDWNKWQKSETERLVAEMKELEIKKDPWMEIPFNEAWEEVDETTTKEITKSAPKFRIDWDTMKVKKYESKETTLESRPTGRKIKQLKQRIRFDDNTGKFYRPRTPADVKVNEREIPKIEFPEYLKGR